MNMLLSKMEVPFVMTIRLVLFFITHLNKNILRFFPPFIRLHSLFNHQIIIDISHNSGYKYNFYITDISNIRNSVMLDILQSLLNYAV